jgi:regulator of protease activity HflC (stomatin/prohibitin superfamily)
MEKRKSAANIFMEQQKMSVNDDFDESFREQENAPYDLTASTKGGMPSAIQAPLAKKSRNLNIVDIKSSEELQLEKEPIKVRITGFGLWKRVIVPPNAYVIHTRIGRKEPVTIGLGVSFRYNPNKDAFMVVPAAMQTIGVVANCITKEKQGINILAYLQWQINDFAKAYKKLDFSELRDPLGIVNAQLREQAEAAIKDKIATMSVEEVLTDKAPIINELTERLKDVAEGNHAASAKDAADEGLGIKITTVQIREAIVSSETLWTDLQSPFRNEMKKKSRISSLDTENEIKQKEFQTRLLIESGQSKTDLEIEMMRQKEQTEINEVKIREEAIRFALEQQNIQANTNLSEQTTLNEQESTDRIKARENEIRFKREIENINIEKQLETNKLEFKKQQIEQQAQIIAKESELKVLDENNKIQLDKIKMLALQEKQTAEHQLKLKFEEERRLLELKNEQQKAEIEKFRMEIQNLKNNQVLFGELIAEMPKIAAEMPEIKELKIIQSDGNGDRSLNAMSNFITKILAVGESFGIGFGKKDN